MQKQETKEKILCVEMDQSKKKKRMGMIACSESLKMDGLQSNSSN